MRHPDPDIRLAERALRHNWAVPDDKRAELVESLITLALDKGQKARQRITAIKTLLMAEALDLKAVETAVKADEYDTLKDRIARLEAETRGEYRAPPRTLIVPDRDDRWPPDERPALPWPARAEPPCFEE